MHSLFFRGTVREGKFRPDDPVRFQARLARMEGRRVSVALKREQYGRSLSQNSYLWGVVYATLAEWSGHDADELHDYLTDKFLPRQQKALPNGEVMTPTARTSTLTVEEFSAYVDRVVRWAAEQGVYVPAAEEVAP